MSKKKNRPKWRQENGRQVATVTLSAHDQVVSMRRASREAAKEAGALAHKSGAGVHGGGKDAHNRRDRREVSLFLRQGRHDN